IGRAGEELTVRIARYAAGNRGGNPLRAACGQGAHDAPARSGARGARERRRGVGQSLTKARTARLRGAGWGVGPCERRAGVWGRAPRRRARRACEERGGAWGPCERRAGAWGRAPRSEEQRWQATTYRRLRT